MTHAATVPRDDRLRRRVAPVTGSAGSAGSGGAAAGRWDADTALEQLYAAHWRQLVRLSVLLVRDVGTAEEVVQDAFVAAHGRWGRLRDPERALAYLRQAVVNRSRSVLRHRAVVERHARREAGLGPVPDDRVDSTVAGHEVRETVLAALADLPRRQREVLVLRHFLDLSEAQVAETLGISRGAVKSHTSRGSAALRAALAALLEDES